jgi:hypothetical protein
MIEYLYLDDEEIADINAYVTEIEESVAPQLEIKHEHPRPYKAQMDELEKVASTLQGLMLDLRLDQFFLNEKHKRAANPDAVREDEDQADYRAATIAQEIRTRATERLNDEKSPRSEYEYPIVLCSTNKRLRVSYNADDTSHDLFDIKFVKTDITNEREAFAIAMKMLALVQGYESIKKIRKEHGNSLTHYLGHEIAAELLDSKILVLFETREGMTPAHEFARFTIRELLDTSGPLIDRATVAARLGVDISEGKSPQFDELLAKHFSSATYQGVFAKGWPRWWAAAIEKSWRELENAPILRTTPAEGRVDFLKNVTSIHGIEYATPVSASASHAFWVVCHATQKPLDPKEGFLLNKQPLNSWQDRMYVSRDARHGGVLAQKQMSLSPSEEARYLRTNTQS